MNDHIKSEISSYLAGELPESRNRQIEAHAAACEKCRNALSKTRAKQARVKREALKNASTDEMPNFFWDRQRKLSGLDTVSHGKTGLVLGLLVLVGGGYWGYHALSAGRGNAVLPNDVQPNAVQRNDVPQNVVTPPPPPAKKPAADTADDEPKPPVVLHVQQDWKGSDSGVTESRLMVIRNSEAWQALWTEMALQTPLPEVDFTKQLVLGIFAGEKQPGTSILLGRVEAGDTEVSAPYRFIVSAVPAAVQSSTDAAPAPPPAATHPYLLAVIPRVEKKIRLTQKEKRT